MVGTEKNTKQIVCSRTLRTLSPLELASPLAAVLLNRIHSLIQLDAAKALYSHIQLSLQKVQARGTTAVLSQSLQALGEGNGKQENHF